MLRNQASAIGKSKNKSKRARYRKSTETKNHVSLKLNGRHGNDEEYLWPCLYKGLGEVVQSFHSGKWNWSVTRVPSRILYHYWKQNLYHEWSSTSGPGSTYQATVSYVEVVDESQGQAGNGPVWHYQHLLWICRTWQLRCCLWWAMSPLSVAALIHWFYSNTPAHALARGRLGDGATRRDYSIVMVNRVTPGSLGNNLAKIIKSTTTDYYPCLGISLNHQNMQTRTIRESFPGEYYKILANLVIQQKPVCCWSAKCGRHCPCRLIFGCHLHCRWRWLRKFWISGVGVYQVGQWLINEWHRVNMNE